MGCVEMAYKFGNREQLSLLPPSIEDYVPADDPVRFYDAFIDSCSEAELNINYTPHQAGNSRYDPKTMFKILVYAYSYGWRSSRKIERALHHNLSFIWLAGGLRPDSRSLREFRKVHLASFKSLLHKVAQVCVKLDLIAGNVLFVDGSKIRGNASIGQSYSKLSLEKKLAIIDSRIAELLADIEAHDKEDTGQSFVKMHKDLRDKKKLQAKLSKALADIEAQGGKSINVTDKACVNYHSRQGSHAGYNGQFVTDNKHGLIVHAAALSSNNDHGVLAEQIEQAYHNLGLEPLDKTVVADSGYYEVDHLKAISEQGMEVIVPSNKQTQQKKPSFKANPEKERFDKDNFQFDESSNCYICPEGEVLTFSYWCKVKNANVYRIRSGSICQGCRHFGVCTKAKRGRSIRRLVNEGFRRQLATLYESDQGQALYSRRKEVAELPFGHLKKNLGFTQFMMRGRAAASAELAIAANCFNITRMINILGGVIKAIKAVQTLQTA